jgi:hypothetical protein
MNYGRLIEFANLKLFTSTLNMARSSQLFLCAFAPSREKKVSILSLSFPACDSWPFAAGKCLEFFH